MKKYMRYERLASEPRLRPGRTIKVQQLGVATGKVVIARQALPRVFLLIMYIKLAQEA